MERIAHRGAKREFPENTLPAFRRAFELGADAVELDVHATRDGVVVVHHDPAIRTSGNPLADKVPIDQMTWNELRGIELAAGIGVPSLADVLAMTPTDKGVYVEIKGRGIEAGVAATIKSSPVRCAVHSFDHATIARCRDIAPEIPRGILFEESPGSAMLASLSSAGARDLWPRWDRIDAALVERVHGAGARVIAWTVNAESAARTLADMGVDGICTDDVRLLDPIG